MFVTIGWWGCELAIDRENVRGLLGNCCPQKGLTVAQLLSGFFVCWLPGLLERRVGSFVGGRVSFVRYLNIFY